MQDSFSNIIKQNFRKYYEDSIGLGGIICNIESKLQSIQEASQYAHEAIQGLWLSSSASKDFIKIINQVNMIISKTNSNPKPGQFRDGVCLALRNRMQPNRFRYSSPNEIINIANALEEDFGSQTALNYLQGYYKTFPPKNKKLKQKIIEILGDYASINHLDFNISALDEELTTCEREALNIPYKIFCSHKEIPTLLEKVTTDFLIDLRTKAPEVWFASYYLKFIEIHPYFDGNGATFKIILNAVLDKMGYKPVFLEDFNSRRCYEHNVGMDVNVRCLETHIKSRLEVKQQSLTMIKTRAQLNDESALMKQLNRYLNTKTTGFIDERCDLVVTAKVPNNQVKKISSDFSGLNLKYFIERQTQDHSILLVEKVNNVDSGNKINALTKSVRHP